MCQTVASWDLGMSDSTSIWICQTTNNEVRLLDYYENHGVGLDVYMNWLRENNWFHCEQLLPHDVEVRELGTGKSRLEILQNGGLDCRVVQRISVADGIQAVRECYRSVGLIILKSNKEWTLYETIVGSIMKSKRRSMTNLYMTGHHIVLTVFVI